MSHARSRRTFLQSSLALGGMFAATRGNLLSAEPSAAVKSNPVDLQPFFQPPAQFATDFGNYVSPLKFADGQPVRNAADWQKRRQEILETWHEMMGPWPALVEKPKVEYLKTGRRDNFTEHDIEIEIAPQRKSRNAALLIPDGAGPFPAAVVVYYDAATCIDRDKELRDFAYQLTRRNFVTLSLGSPPDRGYPSSKNAQLQPLSYLAYVAANGYNALANMPQVDPRRVGVTGHSYGGKWAMFASCLYDKFACAAWSDGGIVFDEKYSNINYWEPWYLGYEQDKQRKEGIVTAENPRTGAYQRMVETGHNLQELHALMAPRPFLVSGGDVDPPKRWQALNHSIAVNKLLGYEGRVAMTNRQGHSPTTESNDQLYAFFEKFLGQKDGTKNG